MAAHPLIARYIEDEDGKGKTALCSYNDDTPQLFHRWFNNREMIENMTEWNFFPLPHARTTPEDYCKKTRDTTWLICDVSEDESLNPVGYCGIFIKDRHRVGIFRIAIPEVQHRGKGHGRRAIRMFLRWAFLDLDMFALHLSVVASNTKGVKLYTNNGFYECGRFKESRYMPGGRKDEIQMELLKADWLKAHPVV